MILPTTSEGLRKACAFSLTILLGVYVLCYRRALVERLIRSNELRSESFGEITRIETSFGNVSVENKNTTVENEVTIAERGTERSSKTLATLGPVCDNLLENVTKGRWVRKVALPKYRKQTSFWEKKEQDLEYELQEFWVKRGIQVGFWRPDNRCGYRNYEEKPPNSTWPMVGSWCNAKGGKPCCSDVYNGFCMKPSKRFCDCPGCVDLRKFVYAEVSDWIVDDPQCQWRNYSASETCEVIDRSPFDDLHFVGDSFARNMFRTFAILVTADTVHGAINSSTPRHERELCTESQQFFWKECRQTLHNMSETLHKHELCGGRGSTSFTARMEPFYNNRFKGHFLELVKSKLGKPGSLIIVSVGFHMGCMSENEISNYLGPAVRAIEDFYGGAPGPIAPTRLSGRWPQIMLSLPLTIGLLKPTKFLHIQNEHKCSIYSRKMMEYAKLHDIRVLDFRPLTTLVHSFDGTHHGIGVNMMKNQILLNYISLLDSP